MEVSPQLSGHWTYGDLRRLTEGDRTRACRGDQQERYIATSWSEDGGSLQQLTGRNSMNGKPGAGARAATGEAEQRMDVESPRPRHRNLDPLQPGTLRHPRKRRRRLSGELNPRLKRKYSDRAAVHLALEYGQTNLRGKISSQGTVGDRQLQQALELQIQGQGRDQETYPDDKRKVVGR